jgi:hypothetical protein
MAKLQLLVPALASTLAAYGCTSSEPASVATDSGALDAMDGADAADADGPSDADIDIDAALDAGQDTLDDTLPLDLTGAWSGNYDDTKTAIHYKGTISLTVSQTDASIAASGAVTEATHLSCGGPSATCSGTITASAVTLQCSFSGGSMTIQAALSADRAWLTGTYAFHPWDTGCNSHNGTISLVRAAGLDAGI